MFPAPESTPRQLRDRLLPPAGPHFVLDERLPVRVEFAATDPAEPLSEDAQTQASAQAINSALNSVRNVAKMVSEAMSGLPNGPSQMDVRFGIRLDASGHAFVVESGDAASLAVTLTWTPSPADRIGYASHDLSRVNQGWAPSPDAGVADWERAPRPVDYDSDWEEGEAIWEDEEADWEQDDRLDDANPVYDSRGYDPEEYDRDGYEDDGDEDDGDYDYPDPRSWPRRSPRMPWDRDQPRGFDPRFRWP
jgi:hypothetical protein